MANSFYQAYVEILPDFSKMYSEMRSGMAKAVDGADVSSSGEDAGKRAGAGFTKGFAVGGAVAGVVSQVTGSIMNSINDLASQAVGASDATDKFKQTLSFAGISGAEIDAVTSATRRYADQTVYDLSTIQGTTAQLAANGVKDYEALVEASGNLNAVAGGNAETFKSVGMVLTQTAGAGKLTTENWNQIANAIPGASGMIQDALLKNGAYTGNFRDAMEKGQISSEEFNAALLQLGTQPVAVEAAKSTSTFEGAVGNLQATIVGKFSDALNAMKPVITGFMTAISDGLSWLADNYWVIAGIAGVILTLLAPSIWAAVTATWAWTVALLANPLVWIALAIGALVGALVWFFTQTELGRQIWDAAMKAIGDMFNWLWLNVIQPVAQWIGDAIGVLGQVFTWLWENAIKPAFDAIGAIIGWLWNNIVSPIFTIIGFAIALLAIAFQWLYENGVKPAFDKLGVIFGWLWDNVISPVFGFIGDAVHNIGSVFQTVFGAIGNFVRDAFNNVVGFVRGPVNSIIDLLNGMISGLNKIKIDVPSWVPLLGGKTIGFNLSQIPKLASGGTIVGGGLALVGERGPELVSLPTGSTVFDAKQTASQGQQTFNVYPQSTDTYAVAKEVARILAFGV